MSTNEDRIRKPITSPDRHAIDRTHPFDCIGCDSRLTSDWRTRLGGPEFRSETQPRRWREESKNA